MAFGCSVDSALVKSVSPITLAPLVWSVITKLSDDTDRRLTALAGYDSLVQCHCPSASSAPDRCTRPDSWSTPSTSWTLTPGPPTRGLCALRWACPYDSSVVNGSSKAAHFT